MQLLWVEKVSPHGEWGLALPVVPSGKVDDVIMAGLEPLSKDRVLGVSITELGKVHGVVPV